MSDDTTDLPASTRTTARVEPPAERARVCPGCSGFNRTERLVCRRCGVDLETGEHLPWPEPDPDPVAIASGPVDRPSRSRWVLAGAAVLAVVGLVLVGLAIAEVGPFADTPDVPEASFAADTYPDEPQPLVLSDIATMTTRVPEGDRTFVAARMVDDTPETAWRSDGLRTPLREDDPLEIIDLGLEEPAWIDHLLIRNGDQFDLATYEQEGRIRQVRATFDGGNAYLLNLLDEGRGQQVVELPQPELTTMVRLELLDVFPGSESDGVAVSDLELVGWLARPEDAALARERAEVLPADAPYGARAAAR